MKQKQFSKLFVIISIISVATMLISNITATKLFEIKSVILPCSALLFPITYIIGDVISEIYGYKKAKLVIILGFIANAFMVLFFQLTIIMPPASTWNMQSSYETVLGTTPRIFIASLMAFLFGSLSNAFLMQKIKELTKDKFLWVRTIGSTIVGELLDTVIFVSIAFIGNVNHTIILTTMASQYLWKLSYEVLATPFTYQVIKKIKKIEEKH